MAAIDLYCPNCGHIDRIEKVSAIVKAGTSFAKYSGHGDGIGYSPSGPVAIDEVITFSGSSQTELSRLLSPPSQPTQITFETMLRSPVGIIFLIIGSVGLLYPFSNITSGLAWGIGLICAGVAGLIIISYWLASKREKEEYANEMPLWEKAISRWQHLYYCFRCDGVFLPGQNFTVPPQYMMDFIYM